MTVRRLLRSPFFPLLSLTILSSAAEMTQIKGIITTEGSPEKRQTIISADPDNRKLTLCPGPRIFELTQLAGALVSVTGTKGQLKSSKVPCVAVASFEIHEIAKGRPAIIGTLRMPEKDKYVIVGTAGKTWVLSKIPPGLKSLVNTTVICDLVANDTNGEATWLVARAFSLPLP